MKKMPIWAERVRLTFHGWMMEASAQNQWLLHRSIKGTEQPLSVAMKEEGIELIDESQRIIYFNDKQLMVEPIAFDLFQHEQILYMIQCFLQFLRMCESKPEIA